MNRLCEFCQAEERVDMLHRPAKHSRVAPPLGRSAIKQSAGEAGSAETGLAVEPEKRVCWTDQPILMGSVKLDGLAVFQDLRAADERNVVVMVDVEACRKNLQDPASFKERYSRFQSTQRRKESPL